MISSESSQTFLELAEHLKTEQRFPPVLRVHFDDLANQRIIL